MRSCGSIGVSAVEVAARILVGGLAFQALDAGEAWPRSFLGRFRRAADQQPLPEAEFPDQRRRDIRIGRLSRVVSGRIA